jgi:diadenosine tetraphosphate (Ap4A) HIT family hydrolase
MPVGMEDAWETAHSWLDIEPTGCLRGVCCVVAKVHAIELYDLSDDQLLGLMRDVATYARALQAVTGAEKVNYEIHGNTVPHLHVHLYPRYLNDPFANRPIDHAAKRADLYAPGEFAEFVAAMRRELSRE